MYSVIDLDGLPAADRFSFWWEAVARSVVPVHASSEDAPSFWAEMTSVDLRGIQISRVRCLSFEARRTPRLIRRADLGLLQLSLTLQGRSGIEQEDRQASLAPTDMVLYDTSVPFRAWTLPEVTADGIVVQFPREALPLSAGAVRCLTARRLPGRSGIGALLATTVRQALRQAPALTRADAGRLSGIVVDLAAAVLAHELESGPETMPSCTGETMLLRVRDFILRHLTDPELSPATIAAAHSMSVRSLHRLFEAEGATVSAWIRERRLEHCRRDLTDPLRGRQPVRAVAARWGFTDPASFSRAFRGAYGLSPQEYRRQWLAGELSSGR
ncbi:helix-turn-helix domain-containing protein [Streptomyces griseoluteus]|uniref:Helix-turn-helix domain-containing protein n=1 Tax=Streptomyces griseoluteus TaxID=29306 RepID=A0A4Z1D1I8_STRGP|nr:helix-turn-helix domain-containing protein [Streptomyces griseoluteus]TGN75353.1 helix-turn-helix domain-containing protein [Streptomyces griseoluteus]GHF30424.1 AraC family transcriptional regulator [Streptomyces griseoluteus]